MSDHLRLKVLEKIGSLFPGTKITNVDEEADSKGHTSLVITMQVPLFDHVFISSEVVNLLLEQQVEEAVLYVQEQTSLDKAEAAQIVQDIESKMTQDLMLAEASGDIGQYNMLDEEALAKIVNSLPL